MMYGYVQLGRIRHLRMDSNVRFSKRLVLGAALNNGHPPRQCWVLNRFGGID
jgi:hypothetical protein